MNAEPADQNWLEVQYEEVFDNRPNLWYYGKGNWFEVKMETENSQYYIYKTGKIKLIKGVNSKNEYYVEKETNKFKLLYTLDKNSHGMVKIPDSGDGFDRYGQIDKGGGVFGKGDHYLEPKTAAALFGLINEVDEKGWEIHLGDMSSENGKDPWQSGSKHHSGHGGKKGRKGLDIDFRYLDKSGVSFQGKNSSSNFDKDKNKSFFELSYKYGFGKNYCTDDSTVLGSTVLGVSNIKYHEDHGHIGLSRISIEEVTKINVIKI